MKIGIDARMLGPEQAGLGRYVEQLVLGLSEVDRENVYVIYLRTYKQLQNYELRKNFKVIIADIPWYSWQEQVKFKAIIDKEKVDLMHFPHWNVPLFYNKPFIVTVHDLIMYHYPRQEASTHGPITYWLKDMVHRLVLHHAVKKAKQIIVTSEFTKQDVHKTLAVPIEKMTTIYQVPFASSKFQVPSFPAASRIPLWRDNQAKNPNDKILERFGIKRNYVLYVGNAYPHKNLEGLLEAWKVFCEKYSEDYKLVLVGKKNFFYERILKDYKINRLKDYDSDQSSNLPIFQSSIVFTDYVSDDDLVVLYQNASLYIFPSLYEGFGLPPLEAMTYGVPVVSSNAACLPEVLGQAALYFDPEDYEQMAEVIYRGLTDENVRFELQKEAKEELKRSGDKFVTETLVVYHKLRAR